MRWVGCPGGGGGRERGRVRAVDAEVACASAQDESASRRGEIQAARRTKALRIDPRVLLLEQHRPLPCRSPSSSSRSILLSRPTPTTPLIMEPRDALVALERRRRERVVERQRRREERRGRDGRRGRDRCGRGGGRWGWGLEREPRVLERFGCMGVGQTGIIVRSISQRTAMDRRDRRGERERERDNAPQLILFVGSGTSSLKRKSHATSLTPHSTRTVVSTLRWRMRCGSGVDSDSSNGVWLVRHE